MQDFTIQLLCPVSNQVREGNFKLILPVWKSLYGYSQEGRD